MISKSVFIYSFISLISLTYFKAWSLTRDEFKDLCSEILYYNLDSNNYDSYTKLNDMYTNLRSKVRSDFKNGNIDVPIDYQLLVEGLAGEINESLSSVLSFNNEEIDSTKELPGCSEYSYQQKIAKILENLEDVNTTTFSVTKTKNQEKCAFTLNGKSLKTFTFKGPVAIPFYIGIYCPDNTFQVKKVQSAPEQKKLQIIFDALEPITYVKKKQNEKATRSFRKNLDLGLGVRFHMAGSTGKKFTKNSGLDENKYITGSAFIDYSYLTFYFDLAPATRGLKNETSTVSYETYLIRPSLGLNFYLLGKNNNETKIIIKPLYTPVFTGTLDNGYRVISHGASLFLELRIPFSKSYFISPMASISFFSSDQSKEFEGAFGIYLGQYLLN